MKLSTLEQERKTRNKVILFVCTVIAALSAFYSIQSVQNNRRIKDALVAHQLQNVRNNFGNFFDINLDIFSQQLSLVSESPTLNQSINKGDTLQLAQELKRLSLKYLTVHPNFISVYSDSTTLIQLGDNLTAKASLHRFRKDSAQRVAQDIRFGEKGMYFMLTHKVKSNPNYRIEVGYLDSTGMVMMREKIDMIIIAYVNSSFLSNIKRSAFDIQHNNHLINTYGKPELVNKLFSKLNLEPWTGLQTHSIDSKYYAIERTSEFTSKEGEVIGGTLALLDITNLEAPYRASLFNAIAITLVLIIITALIIRIFFGRFMKKILKLKERYEQELTQRTKEIIDSNIELNQIFNSTGNGLRIINTNHEIIRVNDAFCRIAGMPRSQIEGKKCYEIFPGLFCHTSVCPLERIKEGEIHVETEEVRFKRGGKKVRCVHNAAPFLGKDNELIGIIEDFKDITEKVEAEKALKKAEEQFSAFMDSLPVGVFIKDKDGVLLYQNTYQCDVFGNQDLIGKRVADHFPPAVASRFSLEDKHVLESGLLELEESLKDKEGKERHLFTHKFRFRGVDNQWRIGGISIDISKRKAAEHRLKVLSKAISNSPVSVAITSPSLEIEYINPAFVKMTGYSIEQAIDQNLINLCGRNNFLPPAIEMVLTGSVWQGELQQTKANGQIYWVIASISCVYNSNKDITHIVVIMEDITTRKENERDLLHAKIRAEESDRLKSAFLGNLSHEIRTPLNAITGFSTLLGSPDLADDERQYLCDSVYDNTNNLLKLIEDLIEISEIETNQLKIKHTECSVNKLLSDIHQTVVDEQKKSGKVKIYLKKEVVEESFSIRTDQTRLRQVVSYLISNALKFTETGFIEFGYTFKDPETLMFYVLDTGTGIDVEKQKTLFSPFRQADDSTTRKVGGLGLGLAISKHIIEKLGGEIWFTSTPGSGSTFYFTIPYIPVQSKFENKAFISERRKYNWSNRTILVADDIDTNFKLIKAALKSTNANLIWARNGMEAIQIVKDNPKIDLVLMDLVMPDVDGFEATRQIKAMKKSIPVICQTAYPEKENLQQTERCGFDSFLAKPIKITGMLRTIDSFITNN